MDSLRFQEEFFNRVDGVHGISHLFDFLPKVYLFVKNRQSQFTKANRALLDLMGAANESDIIGKTDRDFFVPDIADKYIEEDRTPPRKIMKAGPIAHIELSSTPSPST